MTKDERVTVTDEMVEKACAQHWPGSWPGDRPANILAMRRKDMRAALRAALVDVPAVESEPDGYAPRHELIDRIQHDGKMLIKLQTMLKDVQSEASEYRGKYVDLLAQEVSHAAAPSMTPTTHTATGDAGRVRHKKRGSEYDVIGVGRMQAEDWMVREYCAADEPVNGASVDMAEVTIYRSVDDGSLWVRPREEFEDGRFVALTTPEDQP